MIKICCISDTHNQHAKRTIEPCDLLIHSGDATSRGWETEVRRFAKWLDKQPAKHIVFVPGNHEVDFEKQLPASLLWFKEECPRGHILINEGVEIEGIKIWGSPVTPWFHDWAWNKYRGEIMYTWEGIPDDTNILVTHGPPNGILDNTYFYDGTPTGEHVGCWSLEKRIKELKDLDIHIFGHLHGDGGRQVHQNGVSYYNAAVCDDKYLPTNEIQYIDYVKENRKEP